MTLMENILASHERFKQRKGLVVPEGHAHKTMDSLVGISGDLDAEEAYTKYKALRIKPFRIVLERADSKAYPYKVNVWQNVAGTPSGFSGTVHTAGRFPNLEQARACAVRAANRRKVPVINYGYHVGPNPMGGEVIKNGKGEFTWPCKAKHD